MSKVLSKAANISRRKSMRSTHSSSSTNSLSTLGHQGASSLPLARSGSSRRSSLTISPKHSDEDDRRIKSYMKQYKKLEVALTKFNSKANGIRNTNILRTTILVFLRQNKSLSENFCISSKIYRSLLSVLLSILIKWWSSLLSALNQSLPQISSTNRNAYLECISRIIAREEWFKVDNDLLEPYKSLLISTMDYCVVKLQTLKFIPLAMSAFVGKVFAYSYFILPQVSNALLFLLNVKQSVLESNMKSLLAPNASKESVEFLASIFPKHLHHFINFNGISKLPKRQKLHINCVPPPQHPVKGIKDPNGAWVRRWCCSDSDIFNSFFRHYITILQHLFGNSTVESDVLLQCPGFSVILSHIYQVFGVSFNRISLNLANKPTGEISGPAIQQDDSRGKPVFVSQSTSPLQQIAGSNTNRAQNTQQNDVYYNSIIKIFKILRDINFSPNILFGGSVIALVDNLLINISKEISIYDYSKNSLILNIVYEFINHVDSNINWEFWLSCTYMMISKTDHIQILLKNFAFLFNIWNMIPETFSISNNEGSHLTWFADVNLTYKMNLTNWLISNETFERFMTHWNPIVRSYYLRLLVWRMVGINNFESSSSMMITRRIETKISLSHMKLAEYASRSKLRCHPESPMANRKFGILPVNTKDDYMLMNSDQDLSTSVPATLKFSELRKTHPFEVFDEAIYTCSSLPAVSDDTANSKSTGSSSLSHSLVDSIGKIFKIISTENNKAVSEKAPTVRRSSHSMTSLSTTYSTKSRSSSPSIMSFNSTPTSFTEFSNTSSSESDSSTETEVNQPPELFRMPPKPIRPIYKFDVLIDNEVLYNKYAITNNSHVRAFHNSNYSRQVCENLKTNDSINGIPKKPSIPSISIFINNDSFNKLYISCEECEVEYGESDVEYLDYDQSVFKDYGSLNTVKWMNIGKSLYELNSIIEEYKTYLRRRIDLDKLDIESNSLEDFNEFNYFKKIVPFLTADNFNEAKFLNAG
ncbi:uncharacterized protein PRCAT00002338001 [Priceomyces carsonii]|uniref:uncharacterized protein n=1 Tax=Priceomyces carsonii TaxID=28549 RepID=UPI002ED92570|nr:unnamed protein product [Priceomyces carsonii]